MNSRKIAISTGWQIASQLTMAVLSTVAVKCVALGLTKELAGLYNSAYGYLQLFAILADFGLYAVAVRELSLSKDRRATLMALLVVRLGLVLLSLGTAIVIAWLVPSWKGTPLPLGITIASLVPAFTLLIGVLRSVFQIHYVMHYVFIAEVLQRIVTVALMLSLLYFFGYENTEASTYFWYLWVGAVSATVLVICSVISARKYELPSGKISLPVIKNLLQRALPYGIAFFFIALYRQFDLTLIALLRDDFEIQNAYYGFTMRITEMAYIIPTYLLNSTLPALCVGNTTESQRATAGKTLFSCILLGIIAALFSFFWARPIMALLTSTAYLSTPSSIGADTLLKFSSFSMLGNSLVLYAFYVLLTMHEWKILLRRMGAGVLLSLSLNLLLIPKFGALGAVWSGIIVNSLLAIILLWPSLKVLPITWSTVWTKKLCIFTAVLGLLIAISQIFLLDTFTTIIGSICITILLFSLSAILGLHKILLQDS